ncbi:hypothetical protein M758_1G154900 [Ceratodon purpureus]|nr:hypothetical protein M758_1G154900 [Ceratodon purpureus]
MTLKPGAKSGVDQGLVELAMDPDISDSEGSDTDSVAAAEPEFGHFLMNFPYEELPEEKGQSQPHGLMSFPYEEFPEEKKGQSRPQRMMNVPYEEASMGIRGEIKSLTIMDTPNKGGQRIYRI